MLIRSSEVTVGVFFIHFWDVLIYLWLEICFGWFIVHFSCYIMCPGASDFEYVLKLVRFYFECSAFFKQFTITSSSLYYVMSLMPPYFVFIYAYIYFSSKNMKSI